MNDFEKQKEFWRNPQPKDKRFIHSYTLADGSTHTYSIRSGMKLRCKRTKGKRVK